MEKEFDWKIAEDMHGKEYVALLRDLHDTHLSQSDFVERFVKLPMTNGQAKRGHRSPSVARKQYNRLKDRFGF